MLSAPLVGDDGLGRPRFSTRLSTIVERGPVNAKGSASATNPVERRSHTRTVAFQEMRRLTTRGASAGVLELCKPAAAHGPEFVVSGCCKSLPKYPRPSMMVSTKGTFFSGSLGR